MKLRHILTVISFCLINFLFSQSLGFVIKKTGFISPLGIENANDGRKRLFIVERAGVIKIIDSTNTTVSTAFITISSKINTTGEGGLLGLAFHPNYKNNGYFFLNYTNLSGHTVIARYQVSSNPNVADATSEKILMTINQPYSNHNGGCLKFSPRDGYLYIAMGDGGSGDDPQCYAQDTASLLGKMLRIDIDANENVPPYYGVPNSNPYKNVANSYKPEVWSVGLRNPWRFSFDRVLHDIWIADVGQGAREEVNKALANSAGGENYGWRVHEGTLCNNDPTDPADNCINKIPACGNPLYKMPIFEYDRSATGGKSITGGFVYRGCDFPKLYGKYICADYISNNAWTVSATNDSIRYPNFNARTSSFGEDESGELYAASLSTGTIVRVVDNTETLVRTITGNNLTGTISAVDSIIVNGPMTIQPNTTLILETKKVIIKTGPNVQADPALIVRKRGCN